MPLVGEVYLNAPPGMMTYDGMTFPKGLNCVYSLGYTGRLTNWMTAMMFRCRWFFSRHEPNWAPVFLFNLLFGRVHTPRCRSSSGPERKHDKHSPSSWREWQISPRYPSRSWEWCWRYFCLRYPFQKLRRLKTVSYISLAFFFFLGIALARMLSCLQVCFKRWRLCLFFPTGFTTDWPVHQNANAETWKVSLEFYLENYCAGSKGSKLTHSKWRLDIAL